MRLLLFSILTISALWIQAQPIVSFRPDRPKQAVRKLKKITPFLKDTEQVFVGESEGSNAKETEAHLRLMQYFVKQNFSLLVKQASMAESYELNSYALLGVGSLSEGIKNAGIQNPNYASVLKALKEHNKKGSPTVQFTGCDITEKKQVMKNLRFFTEGIDDFLWRTLQELASKRPEKMNAAQKDLYLKKLDSLSYYVEVNRPTLAQQIDSFNLILLDQNIRLFDYHHRYKVLEEREKVIVRHNALIQNTAWIQRKNPGQKTMLFLQNKESSHLALADWQAKNAKNFGTVHAPKKGKKVRVELYFSQDEEHYPEYMTQEEYEKLAEDYDFILVIRDK